MGERLELPVSICVTQYSRKIVLLAGQVSQRVRCTVEQTTYTVQIEQSYIGGRVLCVFALKRLKQVAKTACEEQMVSVYRQEEATTGTG